MVNESEKILSAFSKLYFFDELVHDNLKFTPLGNTEKEVADVLLNLWDVIVAIQLKWRNDKNISGNEEKEIKWLGKQCKEAKKQVKESIGYIQKGELPAFENGRKQKIVLNAKAKIIPLIIFMNKEIKQYEHIIWKHSNDGMNVNCMSYEDFQKMCEILVTPIEIVEYLEWRLRFYENNGSVDILIHDSEDGTISFTKPKRNEALVFQFLSENYGIQKAKTLERYTQMFRDFLHRLPGHTIIRSEENSDYEIISFFSHFNRLEIQLFLERLDLTIQKSKEGEYKLTGSLRNILRKYVILFVSSKYGNGVPMEYLLGSVPDKSEVETLLQVVIYWENDIEYRVDFHYCDFRKNR